MSHPENPHFQFHQQLLTGLRQHIRSTMAGLNSPDADVSEDEQQLLDMLEVTCSSQHPDEAFIETGQRMICRIIAAFPHLTPAVPRDLLWLFGGDCLHYMPDEEISLFQQLDELRFEAEDNNTEFDYEKERAKVLGLH
jgi:hypothetical protein